MTAKTKRKSTGQLVFEQLQEKIISGDYAVGSYLPSERDFVLSLGVSRSAVREALQRLAQSKLVTISHGGGTRVNNFQDTAGLDLLKNLVSNNKLVIDLQIFRSLMEIRSALAIDAARLAALRRNEQQQNALSASFEEMKVSENALELQQRTIQFWDIIIVASDNIAYKLAINTLKDNYAYFERYGENFSIKNYKFLHYQQLRDAIVNKQDKQAELAARIVVDRDAEQLLKALQAHQLINK